MIILLKGAKIFHHKIGILMTKLQYLLDTNICIYIAKHEPKSVLQKFTTLSVGQVGMSTITYAELLFGAEKSQHRQKVINVLMELASFIIPLPIPITTAKHYAKIRGKLEQSGSIIGNNDLWIAAHCLELGVTLVTNNLREFARVPNLTVVNWV